MKLKVRNIVSKINPRNIPRESRSEETKRLDKQFREEIISEVGIYPESEKRFAKYNDQVCDICGQTGCDYRVKFFKEFFHKKCYDLLIEKTVMHAAMKKYNR